MFSSVSRDNFRAATISICSGKGGVGKSTVAMLLAARLAHSGRSTLLIDADFGIGDLATMTNTAVTIGFESVLTNSADINDSVSIIGVNLSLLATNPGFHFDTQLVTKAGLLQCAQLDRQFEVIVIDSPATLDPFLIRMISCCDFSITVTTPRIPAIADSYIQLKHVIAHDRAAKRNVFVNQASSPQDGEQTISKFAELVQRFSNHKIESLGYLEIDTQLAKAAENQSLLEFAQSQNGIVKKLDSITNELIRKHLQDRGTGASLWNRLAEATPLKSVVAFDDRSPVVQF